MGKRKKIPLPLYLSQDLLDKVNSYCESLQLDRNTFITSAIEDALDADVNEHEITFYLCALGLDFDDMVKLLKEKYRDKCIEKGIPI